MTRAAREFSTYKKVTVETASQRKLIIMLLNGAIQRGEEARRQLERGKNDGVHNNLIRAQEILGELRNALNMNAGEVARNLDRLYEYFQHLLVRANLRKEAEPIAECVRLLTELRDTWQEAFEKLVQEEEAQSPVINPHGSAVLNLEG